MTNSGPPAPPEGPASERSSERPRGRVGRPRANPRPLSRPPQEEILLVAGALFAQKGFAGTSTREIAEAAGLRQPSLFHYYPRKELILQALLDRIGRIARHISDALSTSDASPAAKLYRAVYEKTLRLRTAAYPVGAILVLPEARDPAFADFWRDYEHTNSRTRGWIEAALSAGQLQTEDPELAEYVLRGLLTGPLAWARRDATHPAEQLAHQAATLQLRALGASDPTVRACRGEAAAIALPPLGTSRA